MPVANKVHRMHYTSIKSGAPLPPPGNSLSKSITMFSWRYYGKFNSYPYHNPHATLECYYTQRDVHGNGLEMRPSLYMFIDDIHLADIQTKVKTEIKQESQAPPAAVVVPAHQPVKTQQASS